MKNIALISIMFYIITSDYINIYEAQQRELIHQSKINEINQIKNNKDILLKLRNNALENGKFKDANEYDIILKELN